MIDISEQRLVEARDAGASWTATPDTARAQAHAHDSDVVFVTAGSPGAVQLALSLADVAGTVVNELSNPHCVGRIPAW